MIIVSLLLSFIFSTVVSIAILKNKGNKRLSMFSALVVNSLILIIATTIHYTFDDVGRITGYTDPIYIILIIAIPIVSWVNFFIIQFVSSKINRRSYIGGKI